MPKIPFQKPTQPSIGFVPQRISRQRQMPEQAELIQEKPATGSGFSLANISISYDRSDYQNPTAPILQKLNISQVQQKKVIQKLATQITLDKDKKINEIIVRGRPPKTFTNSMGDHTTAFIVQTEGLNVNLKGKTIEEAIKFLKGLKEHLTELPGYSYIEDNKDSHISQRFYDDFKLLEFFISNAYKDDIADDLKINYLQSAINHYLSARELIPFSTLNVGEKSKGKAGKGHGESAPAAVLSNSERGLSPKLKKEELVEATYKLFDYQSAGMLSVEQNKDKIKNMTGGIAFDKIEDPLERLKVIWNQHKQSLKKMFPKVYAVVQDQLTEDKILAAITKLAEEDFNTFLNTAKSNLSQAKIAITEIVMAKKNAELTFTFIKCMARIYNREADVLDNWESMQKIDKIFPKTYSEKLNELQKEIQEYNREYEQNFIAKINNCFGSEEEFQPQLNNKLQEAMNQAFKGNKEEKDEPEIESNKRPDIEAIITVLGKRPLKTFGATDTSKEVLMTDADSSTDIGSKRKSPRIEKRKNPLPSTSKSEPELKKSKGKGKLTKAKAIEKSKSPKTLTSNLLPMAIQITVETRNKKPKSDDVMDTEETEIIVTGMNSGGRPASPFKGTMGAHSTAWIVHLDRVRSRIIGKTIEKAIQEMESLLNEVNKFAQKRGKKEILPTETTKDFTLATLQSLINEILSFYNLIPGVTREKIDTRGKGEGTYRKKLKDYELYGQGTKEDLKAAINGLFDSPARRGEMWENHKNIIKEAYPDSYQLVYEEASQKTPTFMPTTAQPDQELDDEDDDSGDLDASEIKELEDKSEDENWLYGVNNCLINAITDAAGIARATKEQVIAIRKDIGAAAGEMLFASPRILDIILADLGLTARGVFVINRGSNFLDYSTSVSDNPLYIYHDGINHFDKLPNPTLEEKEKISSEISKE